MYGESATLFKYLAIGDKFHFPHAPEKVMTKVSKNGWYSQPWHGVPGGKRFRTGTSTAVIPVADSRSNPAGKPRRSTSLAGLEPSKKWRRKCPFCSAKTNIDRLGSSSRTWQQWRCPECGKWVDRHGGGPRRNPSHPDCPGVSASHRHYQGKCSTDWNWGVGASSSIAIKTWPKVKAVAMVRPSWEAGLWDWEVKVDGRVVADGNAKSSNHAKKWCADTIGRMFGRSRRINPAVYAVTLGGSIVPGTETHNRTHAWKWADRLTKQTGRKHSVGLKVGFKRTAPRSKGRLNNPGLGMPGMPHTWVTRKGVHVSGGDMIEYWDRRGGIGSALEKRRATVNKMLVFDDHVMVNRGNNGAYVDDRNFIRVVRRAR
jgi:predicted RNA-binding Zn-ribbon protein involved in translation (DUF1610 family)